MPILPKTSKIWLFRSLTPLHHSQGTSITFAYGAGDKPNQLSKKKSHNVMLFRRMPWLKSSHGSQISGIPVINSVAIANLFRRTLFDLMCCCLAIVSRN